MHVLLCSFDHERWKDRANQRFGRYPLYYASHRRNSRGLSLDPLVTMITEGVRDVVTADTCKRS